MTTTLFAAETIDRYEAVANRLVEAINRADHKAVQQDFGVVMLKAFPLEKSKPFFSNLTAAYGKIKKLEAGRFTPPNQAVFAARFERGIFDLKIVLDEQDKIIGLWFLPPTPVLPVPEKHETKLTLPFNGLWIVAWGGDTKQLNHHHDVPNQKYAFDLFITGENGKTHKGDGTKNEDYYAFGKEVLAPADGTVTDVIRGVRDNKPGSMNPYSALGNAVVIKHKENEISVIAHFKKGSIKVEEGQIIKQGQLLGLCGNSGNSSEAHIHYHLQNTPIIQDGTGIKCFFENVIVTKDDKNSSSKRHSPVKGELIRPQ
jgi:hypothetical protein